MPDGWLKGKLSANVTSHIVILFMYQPKKVKLYVKPSCGWCRQAEHWLESNGVKFEAVDVIENPAVFDEMERLTGQTLAPCIEVDGHVLADFDARQLVLFWKKLGETK